MCHSLSQVMAPDNSGTLYDTWEKVVGTLGSGSGISSYHCNTFAPTYLVDYCTQQDYVPFLDHAGIASIDITFNSSAYNGVYHSMYDSLYWMQQFGGTSC